MAQRARRINLSRTERLKLPKGRRFTLPITTGVALVYRREQRSGFGKWFTKILRADGTYPVSFIANADDYQDANGVDVLTLDQALMATSKRAEEVKKANGTIIDDTVSDAGDRYIKWFEEHRRGARETKTAYQAHIVPALGALRLRELTTERIRAWHEALAAAPARVRTSRLSKKHKYKAKPTTADEKRARRATANRILTILKAILNRAFEEKRVPDDSPWRRVKPFKKVDQPRIRFLTDSEATRLLNACSADIRRLVHAALLTGARYGELIAMQVRDVDLGAGTVYIAESKSGKPRYVPLNNEGVSFFRNATVGKTGSDLLFTRADGNAWGKNHHVRGLLAACEAASIKPAIAFHELRHTYASHLAKARIDLLTISKLLGHADTRITSRHYAHLADDTLAAAVTKLPAFGLEEAPRLDVVRTAKPRRRVVT